MATYDFPAVTPNEMSITIVSNTQVFRSPFTGAMQTLDRGGEHLIAQLNYRTLQTADKALLTAFLARLNGQQHRCNLPYHAIDNQGNFGGTPLVAGASQTGNTLNIDGCSLGITDWIKAGDFFSVNGEMKIATLDANSDGAGLATLTFSPRLRTSPPNNDPIEVTNPTGVFMLSDNSQGISQRPGPNGGFADLSITFVEDITQ